MEVKTLSDGKTIHCVFDSLMAFDTNNKGKLDIFGLTKAFGKAGPYAWMKHRDDDHTFVLRSQSIQVCPPFYSTFSPKQQALFVLRIIYVGKTSMVVRADLQEIHSGELIASTIVHQVFFDRRTRRSTPLPTELVRKFPDLTKMPVPIVHNEFSECPSNPDKLCRHSVVVPPGDIDWNNHTAHTSYVKYCIDCATLGARDGVYSIIQKDPSYYPIMYISLQYIGESVLSDTLLVTSWEDSNKPSIVHFIIQKEGEQIVRCSIHFNIVNFRSKM